MTSAPPVPLPRSRPHRPPACAQPPARPKRGSCKTTSRPPVPHLILYGRSASGKTSWPEMQKHARAGCDSDANCAGVHYVPLPETPQPPVTSNFSLWGHWLHVENPLGTRAEIEAFVSS